MSECIKQCRFTCIRIAYQGDGQKLALAPVGAMQGALGTHVLYPIFQFSNPPPDPAPVRFKFLFAGAACPDSSPESRKQYAVAGEAGQKIIQLCKLHLQLSLAASSPPGENIENELGAVDHFQVNYFFEVAKLRRGQIIVEDYQIGARAVGEAANLLRLPATHEGRGVGLVGSL